MNSSRKLMNLSARQLHAFLEIGRLKSFARAAEQVHLSPSGMSMLVKELEEQVGARLFDRTTRAVTLTEVGLRLQPVAERIVQDVRGLGDVVEGTQAAVRQRLQIAATPMVAASLLPAVLSDFAAVHPQVRIGITDVDVNQVREDVLAGEADLGLGFFVRPAVGLLRQPLCRFRLMSIRPPGVQGGGRRPSQPWHALTGVPLISLPADNPMQVVIEKHLAAAGCPVGERQRVNLIGTVIALVRAGHGHAVIPSFVLDDCLRQGLDVRMLRDPVASVELFLVSRRGRKPGAAAQAFTTALRTAAARLAR
ncbi:LysR substrate-binding domain-containing protein (plasmid) [Comamonadaceae bacterium OTU4NAUVB1]|jgi:LysR family carnitine catabolism transcriptional activator|nr:LysR substrate-binding domain-containing protein [Comamonadaceae bacterium OTU4NAUVB1]HSU20380.1 LysR substrate-binding domain-containing protein [Variovorax sp.]